MKKTGAALAAIMLVTAWGCVIRTEHKIDARIQLDIRHVQEQAEGVLDYIEGKRDTLPGFETPANASTSSNWDWLNRLSPMPAAHASELVTTSPQVQAIARSLRERHDEVEAFKRKGCFGENNRGYIDLKECDALEDAAERNKAQQLLADENRDRKALYNEVARLNRDQNVTVGAVERVYAMERLRRARSGEIFQLPPAGEDFEEFKQSSAGQRLGDECIPNAWVVL